MRNFYISMTWKFSEYQTNLALILKMFKVLTYKVPNSSIQYNLISQLFQLNVGTKHLQFIYLAVEPDTQNAGVVFIFGSISDINSAKQYMIICRRKLCIKDVIKCIIGMANYIDTKELERCLHRY